MLQLSLVEYTHPLIQSFVNIIRCYLPVTSIVGRTSLAYSKNLTNSITEKKIQARFNDIKHDIQMSVK
jgi:hypothetical protein